MDQVGKHLLRGTETLYKSSQSFAVAIVDCSIRFYDSFPIGKTSTSSVQRRRKELVEEVPVEGVSIEIGKLETKAAASRGSNRFD